MTEFRLSDYNNDLSEEDCPDNDMDFIRTKYVKEFIRLLKEEFSPQNNSRKFSQEEIKERIDKLAGDELL